MSPSKSPTTIPSMKLKTLIVPGRMKNNIVMEGRGGRVGIFTI